MTDEEIAATIVRLCEARGEHKTLCPSEVARALLPDGDWRSLMNRVRRVAAGLAAENRLHVTQRGKSVDALTARGPVRLGTARRQ